MKWFDDELPGLAEGYFAAVELSGRPVFRGCGRLLAHAVRDLIGRIPDGLTGYEAQQLQYTQRIGKLKEIWMTAGLPLSPTPSGLTGATMHGALPAVVYDAVQTLLRDHTDAGNRPFDSARRLFEAMVVGDRSASIYEPVARQWESLRKWAQREAHYSHDRKEEADWTECIAQLALMERILLGLIKQFFEVAAEIDAILEDANS